MSDEHFFFVTFRSTSLQAKETHLFGELAKVEELLLAAREENVTLCVEGSDSSSSSHPSKMPRRKVVPSPSELDNTTVPSLVSSDQSSPLPKSTHEDRKAGQSNCLEPLRGESTQDKCTRQTNEERREVHPLPKTKQVPFKKGTENPAGLEKICNSNESFQSAVQEKTHTSLFDSLSSGDEESENTSKKSSETRRTTSIYETPGGKNQKTKNGRLHEVETSKRNDVSTPAQTTRPLKTYLNRNKKSSRMKRSLESQDNAPAGRSGESVKGASPNMTKRKFFKKGL
jgi:hypothetical protein